MPGGLVKAAGIERFGGDVRELSLPDPRPAGAGETLITVRAAGVGPWDDLVRLGSWDVGWGRRWRWASRRQGRSLPLGPASGGGRSEMR